MYYIVKRTFKHKTGVRLAGSIVEPADFRDFKYRVRDNLIVEVNEQNFNSMAYWFRTRHNLEIPHPSLFNRIEELNKDLGPKNEKVDLGAENTDKVEDITLKHELIKVYATAVVMK